MTKTMTMPRDVSKTHDKLRREVVVLYTKWQWFKTFYCKDDEIVQLLDSAASLFFQMWREMLRDEIIITVCRLTDSATTKVKYGARKKNLTIKCLAEIIPGTDGALQKSLRSLLTSVDILCKPFREHRNLRIAHCDVEARLKRSVSLLPSIGLNEVDQALASIAAVLNAVEVHYCSNQHSYEEGVHGPGNAEDLIEFIRRKSSLEKYFNRKEFGDDPDLET
jgi:hypothetical protein